MGDEAEKVVPSDEDKRRRLSDLAYRVTQLGATERPHSHGGFPKGPGTFACIVCGSELFDAGTKYDSGSGWPSFYRPIAEGAVAERADDSLGMRRSEVVCGRCDAHLGHVFPDGPEPTGLRYCMNGVALDFKPEEG